MEGEKKGGRNGEHEKRARENRKKAQKNKLLAKTAEKRELRQLKA